MPAERKNELVVAFEGCCIPLTGRHLALKMACSTFLQNPQETDRRPKRDPRCAPSDCWLDPRISFSNDFPRPAGGAAALASREIMKEISEVKDSPARVTGKESPAEFEFSRSIQGCVNSRYTTMLPADELFYDGKLLPLYMPQQVRESDLATMSQGRNNPAEFSRTNGIIEQVTENSITSGAPFSASQRMDASPISPKAPTCTCRWKDLFGLKKMQSQEVKDASGCKPQLKTSKHASSSDPFFVPGRTSDAGNDSKASTLRSESQNHAVCFLQDQTAGSPHLFPFLSEPLSTADPGLTPVIHAQNWPMDRAMSGSRSSKSSDDSEGTETQRKMPKPEGGAAAVVKHRNSISRARSPVKSSELRSAAAMSPRRGSRGVSPGRPSVGNRPTESSRNAIAARLVVRGLDRSYSSPKPMRIRSGKQRADGSRSLERSTSYSASVRVSPVINMPVYISPGLRKGSKTGIFGLGQLFSSKKEKKTSSKL